MLLFSASDYFRTAWHAVRAPRRWRWKCRSRSAWLVLFGRSVFEIVERPRRRVPGLVRRPRVLPAARPAVSAEGVRSASPSTGPSDRSSRSRCASSAAAGSRIVPLERHRSPATASASAAGRSCRQTRGCSTCRGAWTTRSSPANSAPVLVGPGDTVRAGGRALGTRPAARAARRVAQPARAACGTTRSSAG